MHPIQARVCRAGQNVLMEPTHAPTVRPCRCQQPPCLGFLASGEGVKGSHELADYLVRGRTAWHPLVQAGEQNAPHRVIVRIELQ